MKGLYAIYRKELGHYFVSPIAYVVIGVFIFLTAFFFNLYLTVMIQRSMEMQMRSMQFGMPPDFDVPRQVMMG
ncbi:MAG: ABC transporter permease, partial [Candidatus Acidiferrales bacterium]